MRKVNKLIINTKRNIIERNIVEIQNLSKLDYSGLSIDELKELAFEDITEKRFNELLKKMTNNQLDLEIDRLQKEIESYDKED